MRLLYFNISNGEVIQPSKALPAFRVTTNKMEIIQIETCFNVGNIIERGMDWYFDQLDKEWVSWEHEHPHLMKSLKKFVRQEYIKHPFKYTNFIATNPRFPYMLVWWNTK